MATHELELHAAAHDLGLLELHGRDELFRAEIRGSGFVWSFLGETGEAIDLISDYRGSFVRETESLSDLAFELAELFARVIEENDEEYLLAEMFEKLGDEFKQLIADKDILPMLAELRRQMLRTMEPAEP